MPSRTYDRRTWAADDGIPESQALGFTVSIKKEGIFNILERRQENQLLKQITIVSDFFLFQNVNNGTRQAPPEAQLARMRLADAQGILFCTANVRLTQNFGGRKLEV